MLPTQLAFDVFGSGLEPSHTSEPSVRVIGFAFDVVADLRVGEYVETFISQCSDDNVGQLGCLHDAVGAAVGQAGRGHCGIHALGAEHGYTDAFVAMGDGQHLGQLDRRRL